MVTKWNRMGLMILVMIFLINLIPTATAFMDTASYNGEDKEYTIGSWCILDWCLDEKVVLKLVENGACLVNCRSKIEVTPDLDITITEDDQYLWDFVSPNNKNPEIEYDASWLEEEEYIEDYYETICTEEVIGTHGNGSDIVDKTCEEKLVKEKEVTKIRIVESNFYGKTLKKDKTYTLLLEGKKKINESIEWIPTFYGRELDEWAWWNYSFNSSNNITITHASITDTNVPFCLKRNKTNMAYDEIGDNFEDYRLVAGNTEIAGLWVKVNNQTGNSYICGNASNVCTDYNSCHLTEYYDATNAVSVSSLSNTFKGVEIWLGFENASNRGFDYSDNGYHANTTGRGSLNFTDSMYDTIGSWSAKFDGSGDDIYYDATTMNMALPNWTIMYPANITIAGQDYLYDTRGTGSEVHIRCTEPSNFRMFGDGVDNTTYVGDINQKRVFKVVSAMPNMTLSRDKNVSINDEGYDGTTEIDEIHIGSEQGGASNLNGTLDEFILVNGIWNDDFDDMLFLNPATFTNTSPTSPDLINPIITLLSPTTSLYDNSTIWVNITSNEAIDTYFYSLNGEANQTLSGNTTFVFNQSINNISVCANDSENNWGCSDNVKFYIGNLSFCGEGYPAGALNFTIKDEGNSSLVYGDIDIDITFWVSNSSINKTLSYESTTDYANYTFCIYPNWTSLTANYDLDVEATNYPLKNYEASGLNLSNITTQKTLFLLYTDDGIYVTFQVLNSASQPVEDVYVTAEKQISGTLELVGNGNTDSAGSITFWLDPNYPHNFNFTKVGYDDYRTTITPTQSSYTVILGAEAVTNETNYNLGINYVFNPTDIVLNNDTDYVFSFNITSDYWALDSYGFILTNKSGYVLGSASGTAETGGTAQTNVNTGNQMYIEMNYFWEINNTYMNGTKTWFVKNTYEGDFSLKYFFDDLVAFSNSGMNDFTRSFIAFSAIFLITGIVCYVSGTYSSLFILGLITALTAFFDFVGMISPVGNIDHFVTVLMFTLFFSYIIYEHVR